MERDPNPQPRPKNEEIETPSFCWKEVLDRAFTGWEPADQALERIIDRVESRR